MADMVTFSQLFLADLATFFATPPIFYLFGLICFCFVVKAVKSLMRF